MAQIYVVKFRVVGKGVFAYRRERGRQQQRLQGAALKRLLADLGNAAAFGIFEFKADLFSLFRRFRNSCHCPAFFKNQLGKLGTIGESPSADNHCACGALARDKNNLCQTVALRKRFRPYRADVGV